MTRYRAKPEEVEAIQWWPGKVYRTDIVPYVTPINFTCQACGEPKENHGFIVSANELVCPNDWVVIANTDEYYVMTNDEFTRTFEEIKDETVKQDSEKEVEQRQAVQPSADSGGREES